METAEFIEFKTLVSSIKTGIEAQVLSLDERLKAVQKQTDILDERGQARMLHGGEGGSIGGKAIAEALHKNLAQFNSAGRVKFEIPTTSLLGKSSILSTGHYSPAPATGISPTGQYVYRLRNVIGSEPIGSGSIYSLRQIGESGDAEIQSPEGSLKSEVSFTFDASILEIPTVAAWVNVSRQALDDVPGMSTFLNQTLVWLLNRNVEARLLYGTGVGQSIQGVIPYGTAFDTGILDAAAGWEQAILLSAAFAQIAAAGFTATHVVLHPYDLHKLRTIRTADGAYVLTLPTGSGNVPQVWGGSVIQSDQIVEGTFVAFDASQLQIRERLAIEITVGLQHSENMTKNLATILAECRLQLLIGQAASIVKGDFVSSPA